VTLLTDRNATHPGRGAAHRPARGRIRRRHRACWSCVTCPSSADLRAGDTVVTSGLDSLYPSWLPVARVKRIDRGGDYTFTRVLLEPIAAIDNSRMLLVLLIDKSTHCRLRRLPKRRRTIEAQAQVDPS
jgi:rod shape-determining protein MreC